MFKQLSFILFFIFITASSVSAYSYEILKDRSFSYCLDMQNQTCVDYASNVKEFLEGMTRYGAYYKKTGFELDSNGMIFTSPNFEYFVAYEDLDLFIRAQYVDDKIFTRSDWDGLDNDRNRVADHFDDIAEYAEESHDVFSSVPYRFDMWDGRLRLNIAALFDTSYGFFSADGTVTLQMFLDKYTLKATIAHELFHVVQYQYMGENMWNFYQRDNLIEGTAVLMESIVVDWSDDHLQYLDSSPSLFPEVSIFGSTDLVQISTGQESVEYGSFVWYTFLTERFGKTIVEDILIEYAELSSKNLLENRNYITIDNVLKANYDSNIEDAYLEFITWNYDYRKYREGDMYRPVFLTAEHDEFPVIEQSITIGAPALFGSNYIEFDLPNEKENLVVDFASSLDASFNLTFLSSDNGYVDYSKTVSRNLAPGESLTLSIPSDGNDTVVMIVTPTEDIFDPDSFNAFTYPYTYQAKLSDLESNTIQKTQLDSSVKVLDYFDFDGGNSWDIADNVTDEVLTSVSTECDERKNCIFYDGMMIYEFGNQLFIDLEGAKMPFVVSDYYSVDLNDDALTFLNENDFFDQKIINGTYSCTSNYLDSYDYYNMNNSAIENTCGLVVTLDDGSMNEFKLTYILLKGVGIVEFRIYAFFDGIEMDEYFRSYVVASSLLEGLVINESNDSPFSDMDIENQNYQAVVFLRDNGIINGYDDGTFKPMNEINRAEFLKILIEASYGLPDASYADCFSDVSREWFAPYICYASDQGWVNGYDDGSFKPAQTVNRVEALKMLKEVNEAELKTEIVVEYDDVDKSEWYYEFVRFSDEYGLFDTQNVFQPGTMMDRGSIAQMIYRFMEKN